MITQCNNNLDLLQEIGKMVETPADTPKDHTHLVLQVVSYCIILVHIGWEFNLSTYHTPWHMLSVWSLSLSMLHELNA